MRVWIDLANSPHPPVFEPIADAFEARGWTVVATARDHAQTVELARRRWPDIEVAGGASPCGRVRKGMAIASRAAALARFARRLRPEVALSHGSYAQALAARATRVPVVTMMDYEHQPANHLSFRLASAVVVPDAFPAEALRRLGAGDRALRYTGFKEELYLAGFEPDRTLPTALGIDERRPLAVFRPPPEGALYHRMANSRFDETLSAALAEGVQVVLLPRTPEQLERYAGRNGVIVPERAVDGRSLLALADLTIGAGGTMNRESALLGTPTYTVFSGRLGAVDEALLRSGLLRDLRDPAVSPRFARKPGGYRAVPVERRDAIVGVVVDAVAAAVRKQRAPVRARLRHHAG